MLVIKDLHAAVDGKTVLRGVNLEVGPGELHAVMGPNGSGKSTLAYILSGREGYEIESGDVLYEGKSLLDLNPEDRAKEGVFLAFQYPVEIPGVSNATFLRTAVNCIRVARGEEELNATDFLKEVRAKLKALEMDEDLVEAHERTSIEEAIADLRAAMVAEDHRAIQDLTELLDRVSGGFAQRRMERALSRGLKDMSINALERELKDAPIGGGEHH